MERPASSPHAINFDWLIRLRWAAVVGQVVVLGVARWMGIPLPNSVMLAVLVVVALTNVACMVCARGGRVVREHWLLAVMVFDTLALTSLLYLSGGPFNPFSFLYLVQIALAAVVLRESFTWMLVLLAMACSALLFVSHRPLLLGAGTHDEHMRFHLRGMWVAFTVAAASIVYFLMRVVRALAHREADLASARELAARQQRLAALATLSAGAAHELSTPLSTIAVAAKELERGISQLGGEASSSVLEDVRLIRSQVARCREILERMAADAGESAGEGMALVAVGQLLERALCDAAASPAVSVEAEAAVRSLQVRLPPRAVTAALSGLLKNAQQASHGAAEIRLRVTVEGRALRMEVRDRGAGMAPEVLARAGEPFFTTKPPGQGMGLGLFLSRALMQRLGGDLSLSSAPGAGTTAALLLPIDGAAKNLRMGSGLEAGDARAPRPPSISDG